ncbi:hypothetical protein ACNOYE_23975 [Nannocystaceae bacterium ST9]
MLRGSPLLALALLACRTPQPDAPSSDAQADEPGSREAGVAQPSHLRLAWDASLFITPSATAIALHPGPPEDPDAPGPVVAVIGREGEFWKIETLDDVTRERLGGSAIAGLDFYRLEFYVPIGVGEPLPASPPTPEPSARELALEEARTQGMIGLLATMVDPPVQTGEPRPSERETDFRVAPSTAVYWADGRRAGEVRREHAFVGPGEPRMGEAGELRCFAIRVGEVFDPGEGTLCFPVDQVREVAFTPEHGSPFGEAFGGGFGDDDVSMLLGAEMGGEIGDAYVGGGLIGAGEGGGGQVGGGQVGLGGLADLDQPDHGTTKVRLLSASGDVDGDVGRRIVRARFDQVRTCLISMSDSPSMRIELDIDIDAEGKVASSKATITDDSNDRDPSMAACVEVVVGTWSFPEAMAGELVVRIDLDAP